VAGPQTTRRRHIDPETAALAGELARALEGEVRFDLTSRALYATDASNYRQLPLGVVLPKTTDDVEQAVAICRRFDAPLLSRGGGTSLSGQTCNTAVVLDFSKYLNRVLEIHPDRRLARVQPGVVLDDLRDAAEEHGLTFAPDPATHNRCTLGGMIGNNSCGVHSVMAGKTDANVESLDVLTYRGRRIRACAVHEDQLDRTMAADGSPRSLNAALRDLRDRYEADIRNGFTSIPRRVSGFDLPHLLPEAGFHVARSLVGTEGTCVTVLEASLQLVTSPPHRSLLVLGYPDVFAAADAVPAILPFGPIGLEGIDHRLIADLRARNMYPDEVAMLPKGRGWLLVEFGGDSKAEAEDKAQKLISKLKSGMHPPLERLCRSPAEARRLWEVREAGLGAGALAPGRFMRWPGWDDSAVAPERMGAYIRELQKLMDQHGYDGAFYGHFGDGCLHVRYDFDFSTTAGVARFRAFVTDAADLVVSFGGSLSGEHGDGQAHGELLSKMYGPRLMDAFREYKAIWDPDGKMNPGKVIDALPLDEDLRVGPHYRPSARKTKFRYVEDGGHFEMAALRCVGVGKCRRHDGGTMCPSYIATREEEHSTRGRARLLFEMLEGRTVRDGWRSREVLDALDLCLSCKACKSECPVGVDMATYKAEFLAHHYRRRPRPRAAYAMGLIHWWASLAALGPGVVNRAASLPLSASLIKWGAGIAGQRGLPKLAARSFRAQMAGRCRRAAPSTLDPAHRARRVILWPDTFNERFHPETGLSAVAALEACGFTVTVPRGRVCCGRPLYDFGMLDLAKHMLKRCLGKVRDEVRAGVPIVVLEPSCASVFRDEMRSLLPDDPDVTRVSSQVFLLGEFLARFAPEHAWPQLNRRALVHGHCHQKAVLDQKGEESILRALGLECDVLDAGCCGMAGAFGFEREHYEVSVRVAEHRLLPAVRAAHEDTLIVAGGFSCREQIRQLTGRSALHLADVIQMAIAREPSRMSGATACS
jgi:FAD/FMN-containing dehydrogenase/Fe-S oxidoreductase